MMLARWSRRARRSMMTAMLIPVLLLGSFQSPSARGTSSPDQWESLLRENFNFIMRSHFIFLSKDFADLKLAIGWKQRQRHLRLLLLQGEIQQEMVKLEKGGLDLARLREIALAVREAQIVSAPIRADLATYQKLEQIRARACRAERIDEYVKVIDVTGVSDLNHFLSELKDSIETVIHSPDRNSPSFSISIAASSGVMVGTGEQWGAVSGKWQDAVRGGCSAAGAIVGSCFGPLGTAVGGVIGSIVGTLIVGFIEGFDSPMDRMAHKLRDDLENLRTAAARLRAAGSRPSIEAACAAAFQADPKAADFDKVVLGEIAASEEISKSVVSLGKQVEALYNRALDDLYEDSLPTLANRFDDRFEAYLAERSRQSHESKDFAKSKILPQLRKVLGKGGSQDLVAQETLWDQLIEGEVRYGDKRGFAFDPKAQSPDTGLLYWDSAERAVLKALHGGAK